MVQWHRMPRHRLRSTMARCMIALYAYSLIGCADSLIEPSTGSELGKLMSLLRYECVKQNAEHRIYDQMSSKDHQVTKRATHRRIHILLSCYRFCDEIDSIKQWKTQLINNQ